MIVYYLNLAMLAPNKSRNILHRARPVECIHGDDVFDIVRLELAQVLPHATGLKLKNADRLAAAE